MFQVFTLFTIVGAIIVITLLPVLLLTDTVYYSLLQSTQDMPVTSGSPSSCLIENKSVPFQTQGLQCLYSQHPGYSEEGPTKHGSRHWQLVVAPLPGPCPLH